MRSTFYFMLILQLPTFEKLKRGVFRATRDLRRYPEKLVLWNVTWYFRFTVGKNEKCFTEKGHSLAEINLPGRKAIDYSKVCFFIHINYYLRLAV